MRLRNNIFAAALDYLKRNTEIKTQKELARRMGVTETTITRILKDYTEVTEDIITKLQTASGCIFNLQWLRGEDPDHMLIDDASADAEPVNQDSMVNETIEALKKQVAILEKRIEDKEAMLRMKDKFINMLEYQLDMSKRDSSFHNQPASLMASDPVLEPKK